MALAMTAIVSNIEIAGRNIGLVLPLLKGDALFYEASLGLLVLVTATVAWIARSRFGFGLIAIRENEEAAAVMGVNTTLYKVAAFALAGFFSALAGGIHAYWITFIDPVSAFDISLNVKMIIMTIFGGPGSIFGPLLGAFLLAGISEVLSTEVSTVASLFFGLVIVLAVIFMPHGLMDLLGRYRQLGRRDSERTSGCTGSSTKMHANGSERMDVQPILEVQHLTKRFAGLVAVDDVSFSIAEGEILGLIGPNGAGKTSIVSLISGRLAPSSGDVFFAGAPVGRLPAFRRARLGKDAPFRS